MPDQSKVTSIDALDSFRASLLVFLAKARPALDEAAHDVIRTRLWLQTEQRTHWEKQVRRRSLDLEEARQELFSARLSKLQDSTTTQYLAVRRAERALAEAEAKLKRLRTWDRELEDFAAPLVKQLENLQSFLASETPRAAAYLAGAVNILEAYAEGSPSALPASETPETRTLVPPHPGEPVSGRERLP